MIKNTKLTLFSKFKISPNTKICIVIPVKDEEGYILKTLSAFKDQKDINGKILDQNTFEMLVLANNCTDRSVEIIKNFQTQNPQLPVFLDEISLIDDQANIGFVRKILMETAFVRLSKNGGGIIMTTDGDTTVSNNWITQNNVEINNGADAVGGRIFLFPEEIDNLGEFARDFHLKDERYQLLRAKLETIVLKNEADPNPRHHQHFNGSFAITTECYERSGGLPEVKHLEDMAFFEKLNLIDAKVRHSINVVVHTSARFAGRTEMGLSHQLNDWKNRGNRSEEFFVESVNCTIKRLVVKRKLMDLWENKDLCEDDFKVEYYRIFPDIERNEGHYQNCRSCNYFGEWFLSLKLDIDSITHEHSPIYIDDAISALEIACNDHGVSCFSHTSIL